MCRVELELRALIVVSSLLAALLAGPALALTEPILSGPTIVLEKIADLPAASGGGVKLTHAGDGSGRRFAIAKGGVVYRIDPGMPPSQVPATFLDLATANVEIATGFEKGLLGLAFHPDFADSEAAGYRKFYTYTSEPLSSGTVDYTHPEKPNGGNHHSVIREWMTVDGDPTQVDLFAGSRELLRLGQPNSNHNGGDLAFDEANLLYISLGDGGSANDGVNTNSNIDGHTNVIGNGQDLTNPFGSILRIDPLQDGADPYTVPDNVLADGDGPNFDEIYAYGLRNPYRISFDSETGDLYAGDVGQGAREEVDLILNGGNYGWVWLEGTLQRSDTPEGFDSIDPIGEYTHDEGNSVIGGYVYRGGSAPELYGKYVFGDYTGGLFALDLGTGDIVRLLIDPDGELLPDELFGIGEDETRELYFLFGDGQVARLVPEPGSGLMLSVGLLMLGSASLRRKLRHGAVHSHA